MEKPKNIPESSTKKNMRVPIARQGFASKGQKISFLTNHFNVKVSNLDGHFYHYSVALFYEDGNPVEGTGIGRKLLDRVRVTYNDELARKEFAYDGGKELFTVGALPRNKLEFIVVLGDITSSRNKGHGSLGESSNESDRKRPRKNYNSKTFKVQINFAAKIPMRAISLASRGQESENSQEALRVLDIILRQHSTKQGCLLVRQSFFHINKNLNHFQHIGGGVLGCRGFHSSFRTTQGGLSLNIDVSTTVIIRPGLVLDFLKENQNVKHLSLIDWAKAKRTLKNLRIQTSLTSTVYKITGLSEKSCRNQTFSLKKKDGDSEVREVTVYDYFINKHDGSLRLDSSADFPCINVGKPNRPTFFPIELCSLISAQRYTKSLTSLQRAYLLQKSRQNPRERMTELNNAFKDNNYEAEPMLKSCGISIISKFTQVEGRVLTAPRLRAGNGEEFFARNGRWNYNNKKLVNPKKINHWLVVNFSERRDASLLSEDLRRCANMKGIEMDHPFLRLEQKPEYRRAPPSVRVEKMLLEVKSRLNGRRPEFILCILPESRNSLLYGPWKRETLSKYGTISQCIAPSKVDDQYLTNVVLKINAKMGGLNSMLVMEHTLTIPLVSTIPTMILGMDVSHASPGQSDTPSVAAVVSSREWPSISKYRASVRTQSRGAEMIESLFKKTSYNTDQGIKIEDEGIIRELLLDFYKSSGHRKPEQIIIFRDGVSESQFTKVLNIELDQIIEACEFMEKNWKPKFVLIIAQKNHHTRFFETNSAKNVPPGTVIDNHICHPRNNDFYMCAQAGMIGTTRPTHYHVLQDEVGFSANDLQDLVHSLSYVYQRSTTAISVVAPICYAHLAAAQMSQFLKSEDSSECPSSHNGSAPVPKMPTLHKDVCNKIFSC